MTNQEVLNKVWQYFVVEEHPRAAAGISGISGLGTDILGKQICQYRTADGNRCAVGCLIPDGLYVPDLEGVTAYVLFGDRESLKEKLGGKIPYKLTKLRARLNIDPEFASEMQHAHDWTHGHGRFDNQGSEPFSALMRVRLTKIAESHGLEIPE